MKVYQIMTADPAFCYGVDSLTKAASMMWQRDCGAVPVIDAENKVIGIITDRDISIAVASRDQKASQITAGELCGGNILTCSPQDEIKKALKLMRRNQFRRLPVVGEDGKLVGILALADLVNAAGAKKKNKDLSPKKLFSLFEAVSKKPPIRLLEVSKEEGAAMKIDV